MHTEQPVIDAEFMAMTASQTVEPRTPHVVDLTNEQGLLSSRHPSARQDSHRLAQRRASNPKEPWGMGNQAEINKLIAADHARNQIYEYC